MRPEATQQSNGTGPLQAHAAHNVVAVRAKPSSSSEQISQIVMGEPAVILERGHEFVRIQCEDGYEGWALGAHLAGRADGPETRPAEPATVWTPFADFADDAGTLVTRLVFGSRISVLSGEGDDRQERVRLPGGVEGLVARGALRLDSVSPESVADIGRLGRTFVGTPYLWGGTTPFGFDCSGLVQRLYRAAGLLLPRDAYLQAESSLGGRIEPQRPLLPGDLVFFLRTRDPHNRGITHVGLMLDGEQMIHAHGARGVTIEPLTGEPITAAYTYRGAWRALTRAPDPLGIIDLRGGAACISATAPASGTTPRSTETHG